VEAFLQKNPVARKQADLDLFLRRLIDVIFKFFYSQLTADNKAAILLRTHCLKGSDAHLTD
jgi:hypothetical protein